MRMLREFDEDNTVIIDPIDVDPGDAGLDLDVGPGD
jgi:hypothetical protein